MSRPNDIQVSEHFKLCEFEDQSDGHLVVLHPLTLERLELLHSALSEEIAHEIAIIVTCGTRTPRSNKQLGNRLGWTDDGGLVSRNSRHLPKFGGIAVDLYALDKEVRVLVPTDRVAAIAKRFFDVVLDHYPTHIHVDLRDSAKPKGPDAKTSEPTQ